MKKLLHITMTCGQGHTYVSFNELLHIRGQDFMIYRNDYAKRGAGVMGLGDSPLLVAIVHRLFADEKCGVESIRVENYKIEVRHSRVVSGEYVYALVKGVCTEAGYLLSEELLKPGSPFRGLQVSEIDSPLVIARVLWRSIATHTGRFLRKVLADLHKHASYLKFR